MFPSVEDTMMQLQDPVSVAYEQAARFSPDSRHYEGEGEFDGAIGIDPRFPQNDAYWHAYQRKLREYWCQQKLAG